MDETEQINPDNTQSESSENKTIDFEQIKKELKIQLIEELKNKPNKESLLTIIWKLTPIATLVFLILSYFYSVKPVFDKYDELKSKQNTIDNLTKQIGIKETDLKDFTKTNQVLKNENSLLEEKIESQSKLMEQYAIKISEFENKISENSKNLKQAENSAVLVHLKKFAQEIFLVEFKDEKNKSLDIRKYAIEYGKNEKEKLKDDKYGLEAINVLNDFTKFENPNNIDNSIFFLSYYYQFHYQKKK
ncbi:hypothetical protein [Aquimarina sp. AU58]|uniref:hypothetical protein n=1 Tax=Aquimarina sp. AU58 TaxID=1874112 RepID=UPI000D6E7765|nr:hypothetical protein [Aquimarina sp. AU58]